MEFSIPTERVDLPSKGLLYPEDHPLSAGFVEMKYMTAKEEDILTNQNYINQGTVIDKLLQSLITTEFNYRDLLIGDKNAIMVAARILSYGKDYEASVDGISVDVDLTDFSNKEHEVEYVRGQNEFTFGLPKSGNEITFKLLTHGAEMDIDKELQGLKKINKNSSADVTTRLKHIIVAVNGKRERMDVRKFVDSYLLAADARALREEYSRVQPDIDTTISYINANGIEEDTTMPIGLNFFWPDL